VGVRLVVVEHPAPSTAAHQATCVVPFHPYVAIRGMDVVLLNVAIMDRVLHVAMMEDVVLLEKHAVGSIVARQGRRVVTTSQHVVTLVRHVVDRYVAHRIILFVVKAIALLRGVLVVIICMFAALDKAVVRGDAASKYINITRTALSIPLSFSL
jgi:hypothetical protein